MTKKEPREILKTEPSKAISPLGTAERWFDDLERWFEEDLRRPFSSMKPLWWPRFRAAEHEGIMPTVDIFEEGDDVVLKTELPGMKKEDIDVSMTANSVTISGEKKHEEKVEKKTITVWNAHMVPLPAVFGCRQKYKPIKLKQISKTEFLKSGYQRPKKPRVRKKDSNRMILE